MKNLPQPHEFSDYFRDIEHFHRKDWHAIFRDETYCRAAEDLWRGSQIVTDLDHTAYEHDAGFLLLEASIHVGLLSQHKIDAWEERRKHYHALSPHRSLEEKIRDEFAFYCDGLRIFVGFTARELEALAHDMWHGKLQSFSEKHSLLHYFYPEMLYLFRLAELGAKTQEHGIVAVTASPHFAVTPARHYLSLSSERLCSMDLALDADGRITPAIARSVHGQSKVSAAQAIFSTWDYASGDNPRNDRYFMAAAKKMAFGIGKEMAKKPPEEIDRFYFLKLQNRHA